MWYYTDVVIVTMFAAWWVLFPSSVIRFYRRFHRRHIDSVNPTVIRVLGALVAVVGILFKFG